MFPSQTRGSDLPTSGRTTTEIGDHTMPLINVKVIEGAFSPEQKAKMIQKLTDAMVEVEGEAMRPVTWTVIEEVRSGDWAIGGKPLSTADIKALGAPRPAKVG